MINLRVCYAASLGIAKRVSPEGPRLCPPFPSNTCSLTYPLTQGPRPGNSATIDAYNPEQ
ncbi:hypothetical protein BGZ61DRAFT_459515 [Ilyonectria robusta]|uniref:uncharacterized protein n=1 Tax=Ilyonectria robusta TaxID=1079257 RepID=UPI001E8C9F2E|nr:uncharacterized protein BGZ61DRAFT_459515 [Ilyonectria robusta]KAH8670519.1 hypothetical protein BGZ61DRAFT_459515 [Ilyonectria robusta]